MRFGFAKQIPRFSTSLTEVRTQQHLSIEQLAEDCEVAPKTIEMIEKLQYEPSVVLASRIALRLGVSIEELFQLAVPNSPQTSAREERLQFQENKWAANLAVFAMFGSLIAANILIRFDQEAAGIALFMVWAVMAVIYLVNYFVSGSFTFNRTHTLGNSRKVSMLGSVFSAVFFGMFMYFANSEGSSSHRILGAILQGVLFGAFTHWFNYRKRAIS